MRPTLVHSVESTVASRPSPSDHIEVPDRPAESEKRQNVRKTTQTTPINGTYEGLAEGTQFTVGTAVFRISYVGGTGKDLVLTAVNSVSAPNTGVLQIVKANPAIVAVLGLVSAASILAIALQRKTNH